MIANVRNKKLNPGDVVYTQLNPTQGKEMKDSERSAERPVMVVSPSTFNQVGLVWVVPITQGGNMARVDGFTVSLSGTGTLTQGVVVVSQLRSLDLVERGYRFVETLPKYIVDDVVQRIKNILDDN